MEKRVNEGFAPWVLVRGTLLAGPGGGLEVPADVPSPYVELRVLFGAWKTRQRWEVFDDSDNRGIADCARVTDRADQRDGTAGDHAYEGTYVLVCAIWLDIERVSLGAQGIILLTRRGTGVSGSREVRGSYCM